MDVPLSDTSGVGEGSTVVGVMMLVVVPNTLEVSTVSRRCNRKTRGARIHVYTVDMVDFHRVMRDEANGTSS